MSQNIAKPVIKEAATLGGVLGEVFSAGKNFTKNNYSAAENLVHSAMQKGETFAKDKASPFINNVIDKSTNKAQSVYSNKATDYTSKANEFHAKSQNASKQVYKDSFDKKEKQYTDKANKATQRGESIKDFGDKAKTFVSDNIGAIGKYAPALGALALTGATGMIAHAGVKAALPHLPGLAAKAAPFAIPYTVAKVAPLMPKDLFNENVLNHFSNFAVNKAKEVFSKKAGFIEIENHPDFKSANIELDTLEAAAEAVNNLHQNHELNALNHLSNALHEFADLPNKMKEVFKKSPKDKMLDIAQGAAVGLGTALTGRYLYDNVIDKEHHENSTGNVILYPKKIEIKKANSIEGIALHELENVIKPAPIPNAINHVHEFAKNHPYLTPFLLGTLAGSYGPSAIKAVIRDVKRNSNLQQQQYDPYTGVYY